MLFPVLIGLLRGIEEKERKSFASLQAGIFEMSKNVWDALWKVIEISSGFKLMGMLYRVGSKGCLCFLSRLLENVNNLLSW